MSEETKGMPKVPSEMEAPKALNYIEKLVAKLCPDGVEYVKVGDIADIGTGSSDRKDAVPDGEYPFYVRSREVLRSASYLFDEESVIIPGEGGIGEIFHFVSGKYNLHQRAYRVSFQVDYINTKFAYYYFAANFKKFILAKSVNATVKSIRKPMVQSFQIPVPPLEVQNAIVEILDKFTKLEAELEAELAARRAQYEYYRNSLFENLSGGGSEILGDLVQYVRDKTKSLMKPLEYVGVENLNVDFQGCTASLSTISGTRYTPSDILLGNIRPYLKKMWISNNEGIAGSDVLVIRIKDEYRNDIVPKFLYYQLTTSRFVDYNVRNSRGGKMPRGNKKKILEFPIFLPPFTEQERIVKILDKFDALVNDISSGLPAEIEARRKQYEYYRDRLLTFPRKFEPAEQAMQR
ncbi:restriction endonuclease subunit S [Rothia dentocariosa]|jgi:restriction modification system DNA specificity domain protein|nr:restriction endonuclease subunit S [Rothia dentocariosa]